jgi:hypothetical protein
LYIDLYKVFEEISSENSSFSEVSDVIMARRRSTRLLTADNVVSDIVAQSDSENEFTEDMARIVKMTMSGLYMMDRGLLLTLRVYNHVLAPKGLIWTIWDNYQLHRMKIHCLLDITNI